jgi:hypothetical protein
MLVFGFIFDIFTFKTLNIRTAFILLGVHAIVVGICIVYLNGFDEGLYQKKANKHPFLYVRQIAPLFLQFSMGALLSAVMIFYLFSGSLFVSWPFLVIVLFLMVSNELFRDYYLDPKVQLSVYYLVLFALGALILPFILKSIDIVVFVLAGVIAMGSVYVLYRILRLLVPPISREEPILIYSIGSIFAGMIGMYIINIIPPIPLAVRDIGVYQNISVDQGTYRMSAQEQGWREKVVPGQTIYLVNGDPLFIYSAIFAPNQLQMDIVHVWDWYDVNTKQWKTMDMLGFRIIGGRTDGFRGYSKKNSLREGDWRVSVTTQRGQVLGRIRFTLKYTDVPVNVIQLIK